ncbi:hypothetical protein H2200_003624 [Cladophialophora chaetospira]|uniref:Uncharacterized protein n=1 Tax=Cladophialophora chaetospira TaxID=386627 RepID=A0AA38XEM2_9EURO|nr:hypothetical protein H2200_003624 [Cladophialophora chaetospira]
MSSDRSRDHDDYKNSQIQYQQAAQRLNYGEDDPLDVQLQNARAAKYWANEEAQQRYQYNDRWFGGNHGGIERQADQRMMEIEKLDKIIDELDREEEQDGDESSSLDSGSSRDSLGSSLDDDYYGGYDDHDECMEDNSDSDGREGEDDYDVYNDEDEEY